MSRKTMELSYMVEDKNYVIFDFDYQLYDNELKPYFENLFCDYFYFRCIGFETVGRFKKQLKNKLDMLYPYYKEYYKTVQQVEIEEFMNTKDLQETFIRTLNGENITNTNNVQNTINTGSSKSINKYSDTPRNKIENLDDYLTSANIDDNTNIVNGVANQEGLINQNNNVTEKTVFHSVGDLGVSSSGALIDGWRNVITNINMLMFDEMEDLFFMLY